MKHETCINCGIDISQKTSSNSKRCEKCCREHGQREGTKKRETLKERAKRLGKYGKEVAFLYGGRCAICNWRVSEDLDYRIHKGAISNLQSFGNQIHHIVAVINGGTDEFSNLILLCPNHHKQADYNVLTIDEVRKYQIKESEIESVREIRTKERDDLLSNDGAWDVLNDLF